jgi:FlaA1/EpsC-like NDP-sugar epimerase
MKRGRILFILSLLLMDAVMVLLAFVLAYSLRRVMQGPAIGPITNYMPLVAIQLLSTLIVFFFYKFYHRRHSAALLDEYYRIFGGVSVATLITVAIVGFATRDTVAYQRSLVFLTWAFSLITIPFGRWLHNQIQRSLQRRASEWSGVIGATRSRPDDPQTTQTPGPDIRSSDSPTTSDAAGDNLPVGTD